MRAIGAIVAAALLAGCQGTAQRRAIAPPLRDAGEVYVYLQPPPRGLGGAELTFAAISAVPESGEPVPLAVRPPTGAPHRDVPWQRLVASGRLAPGSYGALLVLLRRAHLPNGAAGADLLVPEEPLRVELPLVVREGRASVVRLAVRDPEVAPARGVAFGSALTAIEPERPTPPFTAVCSATGAHALFLIDTRAKLVAGAVATGALPRDVLVDPVRGRAFAALAGADAVAVVDAPAATVTGEVQLQPGDAPRDLALAPDGRTLLAMNQGSHSVAFLDADSFLEVDRVRITGEEPVAMRLDPSGTRAYVLASQPSNITVIDVVERRVAGSVPLEAEPLWAELNRAGDRLYVVHRGYSFLTILSVPELAVVARPFVGLGPIVVEVDPRTDLLYLGRSDADLIELYDPLSLVRVDAIRTPGPVTAMAIDPVENTLYALVPSERTVIAIDLTSKRVLARMDVGDDPFELALPGGR